MSTILDALRKLQRERAAQSPAKDLRGSITHESALARRRRRGGSRGIGFLLALLAIGGGGYVLYRSGQVQALLERYTSNDAPATDEEFAAVEREAVEREAAAANARASAQPEQAPASEQAMPAPAAAPPRQARSTRAQLPAGEATPQAESPEILAERARLEAALANARAAQEAQRQAELAAATPQAPSSPTPPETANAANVANAASAANAPAASAPVPTPAPKRVVAQRKPPVPAKPAEPVVAEAVAQPKPKPQATAAPKPAPERRAEAPAPRPTSRAAEPAPSPTSFPDVRVESIRWHPLPERRVASLQLERQSAPEAREGDIVAGVLVYRIDPGSVELRVGSAQRTVAPGP